MDSGEESGRADQDIRQFVTNSSSSSMNTTAQGNGRATTNSRASQDFQRDQLQNMFPNSNSTTIAQAVAHSQNLPEAIDMLLSSSSDIRGIY